MLIRRSNHRDSTNIGVPTFHALAWVDQPDNQRLAFVTLDREYRELDELALADVVIDGARFLCVGIRTFVPGPHVRGDTVGVMVHKGFLD